jgi:hypothetical protein
MSATPPGFQEDSTGPYRRRVFTPAFGNLDPLALPWKEMRRHPDRFPDVHMAKIQSARTVAGLWYKPPNAPRVRIYLKRSFIQGRMRRLLAPFRRTKEWREFLLAQDFLKAGIRVPEPVYYSEAQQDDGRSVTFYATLALEERLRDAKTHFIETQTFGGDWLALARFTRNLHDKGILHADYRAGHVFLDPKREDFDWTLIDLDGSRAGRRVSASERRRALRQLAESLLKAELTEEDLRRFMEVYDPEHRCAIDCSEVLAQAREKAAGR